MRQYKAENADCEKRQEQIKVQNQQNYEYQGKTPNNVTHPDVLDFTLVNGAGGTPLGTWEIGRASCRERV